MANSGCRNLPTDVSRRFGGPSDSRPDRSTLGERPRSGGGSGRSVEHEAKAVFGLPSAWVMIPKDLSQSIELGLADAGTSVGSHLRWTQTPARGNRPLRLAA